MKCENYEKRIEKCTLMEQTREKCKKWEKVTNKLLNSLNCLITVK